VISRVSQVRDSSIHPGRLLNAPFASYARNTIPLRRTHLFNVVHQALMVIGREVGEAETMSCIPPLHCHPSWPHVRFHTHLRRLLVVWNQGGFLSGIVASVVDRKYPRVSIHGYGSSDRLR
jgi:hypothetical protein